MFKRNCPKCNKELTYTQKHNFVKAEQKNGRCSKCRIVNRKGNNVECIWCKKQIYRRPSSLKEDEHYFCSLNCHRKFSSKNYSGSNSKFWKGGSKESRKNYRDLSKKRRLENKLKALTLLGNRCNICAYNKCVDALDFHHIDPNIKDKNICMFLSHQWSEKLEEEIKKCVVLCSNCHREHHSNERKIKNGL